MLSWLVSDDLGLSALGPYFAVHVTILWLPYATKRHCAGSWHSSAGACPLLMCKRTVLYAACCCYVIACHAPATDAFATFLTGPRLQALLHQRHLAISIGQASYIDAIAMHREASTPGTRPQAL